jgi:hypothetical protein
VLITPIYRTAHVFVDVGYVQCMQCGSFNTKVTATHRAPPDGPPPELTPATVQPFLSLLAAEVGSSEEEDEGDGAMDSDQQEAPAADEAHDEDEDEDDEDEDEADPDAGSNGSHAAGPQPPPTDSGGSAPDGSQNS